MEGRVGHVGKPSTAFTIHVHAYIPDCLCLYGASYVVVNSLISSVSLYQGVYVVQDPQTGPTSNNESL